MNVDQNKDIEQLIDNTERIGTIGSPSSTSELSIDILGTAVSKKLVGELACFRFSQDEKSHIALGQITEVQLKNIWLEDPTMRSLARQRGNVNPISGQQDTHLGEMTVSAVFSKDGYKFEPSMLGTVPATGTPIHLATDQVMNTLLAQHKDEIWYLGHVYGSKPKLPMWFKHFGSGPRGAGEAYHIGIFGKNGSGKSTLAAMMLVAYARHPEMAIFIIDPQGQFSKHAKGQTNTEGFQLGLNTLLRNFNKKVIIKSVKELILDRWDLFCEILIESRFFELLSISEGDYRRIAAERITDELKKKNIKLKDLYQPSSFDSAWKVLGDPNVQMQIYKTKESRERFQTLYKESDKNEFYNKYWKPVTELFNKDRENTMAIKDLIKLAFSVDGGFPATNNCRPVVIIDLYLSKEEANVSGLYWNDTIQALVIKRLLDEIIYSAERAYHNNKLLNTLVVFDEAQKFAPREGFNWASNKVIEKLERVRQQLLDAIRTTRKYGLGWMFISQTLSSLHKDIISQIRIFFFGFGLALGTEFMSLKEIAGGESNALKLYQSFRDPHCAFEVSSKQYSFMTVGPVSPLSFSGTPLFFTAFNKPEEFISENGLNRQFDRDKNASNELFLDFNVN
ncbi:ATP-binding protein [Candidatus Methylacidiphilum infernorum]|uniref:HerA helicase n=1 Tax=Methylacidiphilum infernorum (isolate V4) TaxID=481448 RepID=B3E1B1_METI4|nr:DUF87 domain-containing protein [Candidatus Methylacidiphilum infernorum]ACD82907.1 HerA helicase [Methylacidiphilum infernorum V4]